MFKEHMQMIRDTYAILHRLKVRGGKILRSPDLRWTIETGGEGGSTTNVPGKITATDHTAKTLTIAPDIAVLGASSATSVSTVVSIGGTESAKHYVFAYGSLSPLTCAIYPSTTATFPVHTANQWRRALYEVYVSDGTVVVNRTMHLGLIDLTGFYSV